MSTSVSSRSTAPAHWAGRSKFFERKAPHGGRERVWAVERWLVRRLLDSLGRPPVRLVLWNGEELGHAAPEASVIIHDRATFWRLVSNPDLNFGDAYSDGRLEVEGDLLEFLELVYRAEDAQPRSGLAALANRLRVQKINTLGRAPRISTTITTSGTTSTVFGSIARWSIPAPSFPRPMRHWKKPK